MLNIRLRRGLKLAQNGRGDPQIGEPKELLSGNVSRRVIVERLHSLQFIDEGVEAGGVGIACAELSVNYMLHNSEVISTALHAKKKETHRGLHRFVHIPLVYKLPFVRLPNQHVHKRDVKLVDHVIEGGSGWNVAS